VSVAVAICLHSGGAAAASAAYKIVTASERGTYFAIGNDLAKFVAPAAPLLGLEAPSTAIDTSGAKALKPEDSGG
jgi:TRAP-type uncharacterized transport system substrate-binding protein